MDVRDYKVTVYDGDYDYFLLNLLSFAAKAGGDVEQDSVLVWNIGRKRLRALVQRQVKLQDLLAM